MIYGADKIIWGTAGIGMAYGRDYADGSLPTAPDDEEVRDLCQALHDLGIRLADTAPAYGNAEERLGKVVPEDWTVWTKVPNDVHVAKDAARIRQSLAISRIHLGKQVRVVQWHNWNSDSFSPEVFRRIWIQLHEEGWGLGASTYGVEDAIAAVQTGGFGVLHVEYNLLRQGVVEAIGDSAVDSNKVVAVRSVFLQGVLAGRVVPDPALIAPLQALKKQAAAWDMTLPVLALRAALDHPYVQYVVIGLDRIDQCDVIRQALATPPLTAEQLCELHQYDMSLHPATDPRTWP